MNEPVDSSGDPGDGSAGQWQPLRILNSYRLFIAVALLTGFLATSPEVPFGATAPRLFYATIAVYLVLALLFALTIRQRRPRLGTQAHLHFYADVLALAIATYASGGVSSGLATLLVVPIAGAGTLLPMRLGLVYAALASLLVLTGEVLRHLDFGPVAAAYPQAALLGATLFGVALLAVALARRSRQSAELALRRSQDVRRLSALNERIIQQMESGIVVVGHDGRIALANASAAVLLEHPGRLVGRTLSDLAPGLEQALEAWTRDRRTSPEPIPAHPQAARRLQIQFTALGEQVTLLSLEDAAFIEEQVQQLKLASLGRLTASIAHEIRNPLGAISHSAQLLAESEGLASADRRLTEIMLAHCRRVDGIVDNVLQLSRRRRDGGTSVDLEQWVPAFVLRFRSERELDSGRLEYEGPSAPLSIHFDVAQLEQIVSNLCDNALRHGVRADGGAVMITLCPGQNESGAPYLDVRDDGVPIEPQRVEEMFEPFYTTSHSGIGLGLFLARELCQANRAQLSYLRAESGNRFRLTFEPVESTIEQNA